MNFQTDYNGFVKKDGCLCFDLVKIGEKKANQGLSHLQLADLIHVLHYKVPSSYNKQRPVLSDEADIGKPGIFVWDHPTVINQTLFFLNIYDWECTYIGRKYTEAEEARGKISFGTFQDADEMVFQIQTINGGHFRMFDYDSWEPGTVARYLKSVRYYKWKRRT